MRNTWWHTLRQIVGPRRLLYGVSAYAPYVGAGIRVAYVSNDLTRVRAEMNFTPFNRNYVGTQFGGSLYSMCDPFYMIMLKEHLGPRYIVWDKAASIRFVKPGVGRVSAEFEVALAQAEAIRAEVDQHGKAEPHFRTRVVNGEGATVAEVEKVLHVRKKGARSRASSLQPSGEATHEGQP